MEGNSKDPRKEFAEFLKKAYAAYIVKEMRAHNNVPSQTDFSRWLGVTQTSLSNWINGVRPPNDESLDQVALKLGPDVYKFFGKSPRVPNGPEAKAVYYNWHRLTPEHQKEIAEMVRNYADEDAPEEEEGSVNKGLAAAGL